jgi:hypothetical protein
MELSKVVALAAVFFMIVLILTAGPGEAAGEVPGAPRCEIKPVMTDREIQNCRKGPKDKLRR